MKDSEQRLTEMLEYYKISQIVDILYLWVKLNINSPKFISLLV